MKKPVFTDLHYHLATTTQREYMDAAIKYGCAARANRELGLANDSVGRALRSLDRKVRGYKEKRPRQPDEKTHHTQKKECRTLIITWAQNATPVDDGTLAALEMFAQHNDGQIIVIKGRYQNPTSIWSGTAKDSEWWDSKITQYLADNRMKLSKHVMAFCDIKIRPTAVNPLSDVTTLEGAISGIFGHPKIMVDTVATVNGKLPKILATTGAITQKNYTDSKEGKKAEHAHELGACVVELSKTGKFHIRQLIIDDNCGFYDLNKYYHADGVTDGHRADGFISGDFHGIWLDKKVKRAWWTGKNSLCNLIKPKRQYFHDVLDTYWGSHHHKSNPFLKVLKHFNGLSDGMTEIEKTLLELAECAVCDENLIVASNHNEHFNRWLCELDWRNDPENAELYLQTSLEGVRCAKAGKSFDPFKYWIEHMGYGCLTVLSRWDSSVTNGYECAFHGDKGPGGARGSRKGFNKIGTKTVFGHGHGPGRYGGAVQVGISCRPDAEYTEGTPSNWLHTGFIIYPNGKGTLISCIDGEYRLSA